MLNILIIDDEPPARNRMRRLLAEVDDCRVAGEAGSASAALQFLEQQQADVLLLDISMPGLDGMQLARMLKTREPGPVVIFCTAHSDQALDAFAVDAVDYLLKPVRLERLRAALDKARLLAANETDDAGREWLRSTVGGQVRLVALDEVVCLFAEDKYTTAVTADGKALINPSLVEMEQRYGDMFLRVHRNALVARSQVRGLKKMPDGGHQVTLEGVELSPQVSRRQLSLVRQLIREIT
jgi:two-component system response regulator AlgR